MRHTSQRGAALLLGAMVILIFAVVVFRRDEANYRTMTNRAQQIHLAIDTAQAALSALVDAETGQRGYLLTGSASYLAPYRAGVSDWQQNLARLRELAGNDPGVASDLDVMTNQGAAKIAELASTVSLMQAARKEDAIARVNSGIGKALMDQVRAAAGRFIAREEASFLQANAAADHAVSGTRSRIFAAVAILFALTLAGTLMLNREVREERRLAANLERSEKKYRDLAENLEQQVADRTVHLQNANSALQAFSYSVSHDLRAPLRSIDGFSLMIVEDYADRLDDAGRDMLNRVRTAAKRMSRLIQSLLDLSRVTAGELQKERVSISSIAESVMENLVSTAPERKAETRIQPGMEAVVDPHLIRVVLENLLGNAWKFTSRQEVTRIEVGRMEKDGRPIFFVRDNGAGFDPQFADRLFTPFRRLHQESEFEGTGVGLATVQRIIHRHEGSIWAESKPGEGATFFFSVW